MAREMTRRNMNLPLLIGGSTTSLVHTAVKIASNYDGPTLRVSDASRAVGVVNTLLSEEARGAFIEYDMIGMDYYYADQHAQSPCDEENASAVKGLIDAGFGHSILLSQDVFLKMMLTHYGGFGYAHVLRHFVPRLRRHGVSDAQIETLLVDNPRCVFSATHRRQAMGGSDA